MLKLHTKVHAGVCGKPTLKDVKCFRNVLNLMRDHKLYKRSIYEGTILSERIESYAMSNKLSNISVKPLSIVKYKSTVILFLILLYI